MSILLAVNSFSTSPAPPGPPATAPVDASVILGWIIVGWAVAAMFAAGILGAFRRKSIVGPERLAPTESAWDLLVIFVFVYFGGMFAGGVIVNLLHLVPGAKLILLEAAVDLGTFILGVLLLQRLRPGAVNLLGLDPRRINSGIAAGTVTLFLLYPVIQLASEAVVKTYEHFHLNKAKPHEILQLLGKSQDRRLTILAIVLACVIAPLAEEFLFRGLLQTILVRAFTKMFEQPTSYASANSNPAMDDQAQLIPLEYESALMPIASNSAAVRWGAVIITAAVFAAIHIEPAFLAPLFVLALGLGYVYERTGNLWVTITAHALFNTAQILLYFASGR